MPHETDKIAAKGPDVTLEPATAQAVPVALHELSTNAAKYGALSVKSGTVALHWELRTGTLILNWVESRGPPVKAPASHGYGSKVIRAVIERQLGGRAILDWRPEGLRCMLSLPRRDASPALERSLKGTSSAKQEVTSLEPIVVAGNRVLLAEDEGVLALMMRDTLVEQGFSVVGPFAQTAEAIAAARDKHVHAAVLDVNQNGEMIYPVAEILKGRGGRLSWYRGTSRTASMSDFREFPCCENQLRGRRCRTPLFTGKCADLMEATGRLEVALRRSERAQVGPGSHSQQSA